MKKCYCGSNNSYNQCCEVFHLNNATPKTAEQLMRSRYSAFVLGLGDYLVKTHASSTRNSINQKELEDWAKSVKWIKLEILSTSNGKENEESGKVEFIAYFKDKIFKRKIHENSSFIKEDGEWKYLNGVHY